MTLPKKIPMCSKPIPTVVAGWSNPKNGNVHPPRNNVTIMADDAIMLKYSPMKNIANFIELYSVL